MLALLTFLYETQVSLSVSSLCQYILLHLSGSYPQLLHFFIRYICHFHHSRVLVYASFLALTIGQLVL